MKNIFEIVWTRARNLEVCVYSEQDTLSVPMTMLFDALKSPADCNALLDSLIEAISGVLLVTEDHQRRKSGWSLKRTFKLCRAGAESSTASALVYEDSHGGLAVELIATKDIENDFTRALSEYFSSREMPSVKGDDPTKVTTVH